jgi:hypothetical protein
MTTTAKIAAKGTQSTGITETIAKQLHDQLGKTIVAIVEITSEARTEQKSGDEQVKLSIGMIEVAPDGLAADHVRELARSFHYERQLTDGQPTLDGDDIEPKVGDVLEQGARFRPHPYLASTLSTDDDAVCDVCGQHEGAPVHAERAGLDDPFAIPDDVDDADADTNVEPHDFIDDGSGACLECDQDEAADAHTPDPDPAA